MQETKAKQIVAENVISKDKVISLIYELKLNNEEGRTIEIADFERPLTFLYGTGNMLPKFESYIEGLSVSDSFKFTLYPDDAYGDRNEQAVINVPKGAFMVDGEIREDLLQIGNTIPMLDNQGRRLNGIIKAIHSDDVTMDFNHPMAGENLYFKGEVIEIRDATEEELTRGNVHSCSCGGGCACNSAEEGENADSCSDGSCGYH
ncbi:peptidylprolyl isomerase [Bacteroidota bacterium]